MISLKGLIYTSSNLGAQALQTMIWHKSLLNHTKFKYFCFNDEEIKWLEIYCSVLDAISYVDNLQNILQSNSP